MKNLLLAALLLAAPVVYADSEVCSGSAWTRSEFVNGFCSGDYCSGWIHSSQVAGDGSCPSGTSFRATGWTRMEHVSETCRFGSIGFWDWGATVMLSGVCSDGRSFSGQLRTPTSYVSGSCRPNGSFSVFLPSRSVSFSGECR